MSDICREGTNVLDRKTVPIIFVPGVLGTRLHFTASDQHWDPDSKWRMSHWLLWTGINGRARELHCEEPAEVIGDDDSKSPDLEDDERGRGWSGPVASFYLDFLRHLDARCHVGADCPVYAVGYDWRQSIWPTDGADCCAQQLIDGINAIFEQEFDSPDKHRAIIVTHSMGGLVARAALKADSELREKVYGVIHVVQPAVGTPLAYRRFFTGAREEWVDPDALAKILGNTGEKFAAMMHGMPGPMQLMPSDLYFDRRRRPWLGYWDGDNWVPWSDSVFDLYKKPQSPPGLIPHAVYDGTSGKYRQPEYRTALMQQVDRAKTFHEWLGLFAHPTTFAVFSTGLETDMAVFFKPHRPPPGKPSDSDEAWRDHKLWESWRGANPQRRDQGDATVADTSGSALFPLEREPHTKVPEDLMEASPNQVSVQGVEHGSAFDNGDVRETVENWIDRILFYGGFRDMGFEPPHSSQSPLDLPEHEPDEE